MKRVISAEFSNFPNQVAGLSITFKIQENVKPGDLFALNLFFESKPFEARRVIAVSNSTLEVTAFEIGSKSKRLSKSGRDLRGLIDREVSLITDEETINKLREESRWC